MIICDRPWDVPVFLSLGSLGARFVARRYTDIPAVGGFSVTILSSSVPFDVAFMYSCGMTSRYRDAHPLYTVTGGCMRGGMSGLDKAE